MDEAQRAREDWTRRLGRGGCLDEKGLDRMAGWVSSVPSEKAAQKPLSISLAQHSTASHFIHQLPYFPRNLTSPDLSYPLLSYPTLPTLTYPIQLSCQLAPFVHSSQASISAVQCIQHDCHGPIRSEAILHAASLAKVEPKCAEPHRWITGY